MAIVLAIEPDRHQAAHLTAIVRHQVGAELLLAQTTEGALDVIGSRVPDLVLVPALLSPQDDAALAAALRVIAAAAHVRTLTIPVLSNGTKRAAATGVLAKWRRGRDVSPEPDGCEPAVFGEQILTYLREAAAERALLEDDTTLGIEPVPVIKPAAITAASPITAFDVAFLEQREAAVETARLEDEISLGIEPVAVIEPLAITAAAPIRAVDLAPLVQTEAAVEPAPLEDDISPAIEPVPVIEPAAIAAAAPIMAVDVAPSEPRDTELRPRTPTLDSDIELRPRTQTLNSDIDEPEQPPPTYVEPLRIEVRPEGHTLNPDPDGEPLESEPESPLPRWTARQVEEDRIEADETLIDLSEQLAELSEESDGVLFDGEAVPVYTISPDADELEFDVFDLLPAILEPAAAAVRATPFVEPMAEPPRADITPWEPMYLSPGRMWPALEGVPAETPVARTEQPDWIELVASLRQDLERRRTDPSAASADPVAGRPSDGARAEARALVTKPRANVKKARPVQDEWGFFDPEQCGFSTLLAKLDEITEAQ